MTEARQVRLSSEAAATPARFGMLAPVMAAIPLLTLLDLLLGARWPVWGLAAANALFLALQGKQ